MKMMDSDSPRYATRFVPVCLIVTMVLSGCVSGKKIPASVSGPEVAFVLKEKDLIPEGIAYDSADKVFYLGSIHKRKIIKITSNGTVTDFSAFPRVDLNQVLGMKVDAQRRKLWVCSNSPEYDSGAHVSGVHVFDLATGKLLKKYQISGRKKHLFNDLVVTSEEDVYVTDSDGGGIYVIKRSSNVLEEFLRPASLAYPNGITLSPDERSLLVSTGGQSGIVSIDLSDGRITPVRHEKFLLTGIDGLYRHGSGLIAIQNVTYPESVLYFECDDSFTRINGIRTLASGLPEFNTPTTGTVAGDFFYFIANSQLLHLIGNKGDIKHPGQLKEVVIMRVRLH
jgi:sugar lactone lactonase YvrE